MFDSIQNDHWNGFRAECFTVSGRSAVVVSPAHEAAGRPCFWRARFFNAFPAADIAMLREGYHLVHVDIADLYGCPQAVGIWNDFYRILTDKYGIHPKVNIEGMSRGGLISLNWAIANPEKVRSIYLDNPVCDFKSWPAGFGDSPGSEDDWCKCMIAYRFASEDEARNYKGNPLDNLEPLAKAKVPILVIYGDADEVVPVSENCLVLIERYRRLGGRIECIAKAGEKHHPHCLENPKPIVDFVKNAR